MAKKFELIDFNKVKKHILTERAVNDKKVIYFPTIRTSWTQKLDGTPIKPTDKKDDE